MDPRLSKVLAQGERARRAAEARAASERKTQQAATNRKLAAEAKLAQPWIDQKLFKSIKRWTASGRSEMPVYHSECPTGVSLEGLAHAIMKIDGLRATLKGEYRTDSDGYPEYPTLIIAWGPDPDYDPSR